MRKCTSCQAELPLSAFSKQRRNPRLFYRWCDACRSAALPHIPKYTKRQSFQAEMQCLRDKARQLRKLSDEQVQQAVALRKSGISGHEIAARLGVSSATVYKATGKGYR
jgi:hypothetical protein